VKKNLRYVLLASTVLVAFACSRKNDQAAADSALRADLSLANQVAPTQPIDSMEMGLAPAAGTRAASTAAPRRTTSTSTTRRRTTASTGTARTSTGTVTTSSGGEVIVKKNTKRDAAIGAAAGAVIGGTTGGLKGAVIGGVVGGVLGGVIGNNVDVKKTKKPPQ